MLRYFGVLRIQYACILVASYVRLFIYRYGRDGAGTPLAVARRGQVRSKRSALASASASLAGPGAVGDAARQRTPHTAYTFYFHRSLSRLYASFTVYAPS